MKQAISQSLVILALSLVLSLASYALRPDALHWHDAEYEVKLEAALAMEGALWIDARMDEVYAASHLEGAISVNEENWESGFVGLLDVWIPGAPIVVYCSSQSCLRSHHVGERLREELGVDNVFALHGGWEAMLEAGLVKEEAQ